MINNQLTRERLEKIKSWRETYGAGSNVMLPAQEAEELACLALAAMDSEPVGWTDEAELSDVEKSGCGYLFKANPITPHADPRRVILLYRHAQPAPVVPDFKKLARELVDNLVDCGGLDEGVKEKYLEWAEKTCSAAMLTAAPQEVKP